MILLNAAKLSESTEVIHACRLIATDPAPTTDHSAGEFLLLWVT